MLALRPLSATFDRTALELSQVVRCQARLEDACGTSSPSCLSGTVAGMSHYCSEAPGANGEQESTHRNPGRFNPRLMRLHLELGRRLVRSLFEVTRLPGPYGEVLVPDAGAETGWEVSKSSGTRRSAVAPTIQNGSRNRRVRGWRASKLASPFRFFGFLPWSSPRRRLSGRWRIHRRRHIAPSARW